MMRNAWKRRVCILLLVLNLLFIWGNSLLPAELSEGFSNWFAVQLPQWSEETEVTEEESTILRKAAHFTEFASLGFLLSCLAFLDQKKWWTALPWGAAAACIDETIQMFVPARGPGILDVMIDVCGVLAGIAFLRTGYYLYTRKKPTHYGGNNK